MLRFSKTFAFIFTAAGFAYVVGGAILFAIISGPQTLLALPLLLVFGWFYFPILLILATFVWFLNRRFCQKRWLRLFLVALLTGLGAYIAPLIGVKGPETIWKTGYIYGGASAGCTLGILIFLLAGNSKNGAEFDNKE